MNPKHKIFYIFVAMTTFSTILGSYRGDFSSGVAAVLSGLGMLVSGVLIIADELNIPLS